MGIQRFGLRMRGYATRVTLGTIPPSMKASHPAQKDGGKDSPTHQKDRPELEESARQRNIAIIDGPGLAHYIYYQLCDRVSSNATTNSSSISYLDCVEATVRWLDRLRQFGFTIDSIFFDGALPAAKKGVRIDRLQNYIARVQAFKQSSGASLSSLTASVRKSLPPPPFLVFAIVEELVQSSQYGQLTYVVPGEADPYCVAAAQTVIDADDVTMTIFSDDADLLVYPAEKRTRIVPFRDLSESEVGEGTILQGDEYRPVEIIGRMRSTIDSLVKPAFFMSLDYHCHLEKAFRLSANAELDGREEYQTFAQQFETVEEVRALTQIRRDGALQTTLAARDSRVSELFHQQQSHANGESNGPIRLYLPFVMDDPTRSSAWAVGAEVRLLAYSILLQSQQDVNVQEYRRSGTRVSAMVLQPLSDDEMARAASSIVMRVKASLDRVADEGGFSSSDAWRQVVLEHVLTHLHTEGWDLPPPDDAVHILLHREPRKWSLVHLAAQYQAAFYSFRMLQQLLGKGGPKDSAFTPLAHHLHSLPRIAAFFDGAAGSDRRLEQQMWQDVVSQLCLSLDGNEQVEDGGTPSRRRKRAKKVHAKQGEESSLAKNRFAMLVE